MKVKYFKVQVSITVECYWPGVRALLPAGHQFHQGGAAPWQVSVHIL